MSNIQVELLKDVSGELVPISGVSNDMLTKCIKAGDISIDGDKLYGSDNFIIDAKRLKLTVNKLNNNTAFNEAIESELLDTDNLITDSIGITTSNISIAYPNFAHTIVKANDLMDTLSDEVMWGNNYSDTANQTWSPANVDSGKLIIKSKLMVETLFASQFLHNQYITEYSSWGKRTITIGDYDFDLFVNTMIDLIAMGLNHEYGTDTNETNYREYFISYLNGIYSGLGTACSNYMTAGGVPMYYLFKFPTDGFSVLYRRLSYWKALIGFIVGNYSLTVVHQDGYECDINSSLGTVESRLAIFLSSIVKRSWYNLAKAEYVNLREKLSLPFSDRTSYLLGYNCIDLVMSDPLTLSSVTIGNSVEVSNKYNRVFESINLNTIKFVYVSKNMAIKIGKCQTRSNKTETDSGIGIVSDEDDFDMTKLFVPCKRTYRYKPSEYYSDVSQFSGIKYKFALDDLNVEHLFGDMTKESMLVTSGFDSLNWMYFDNIECLEEPIGVDGNLHYDNIPVFDDIAGTNADNYGLYIYADFFDKYYTMQKSNFLNIYIKVTIDGQLIYFGIVDYTTVSSSKKTISFEATDAIGVMIENIKKLSQMVSFAQFSTTDELIADTRSGSVIGSAIQEIIRTGHIYRTRLVNPDFVFPVASGLNNKLLADITMEDALILALQCSKKILMLDSNGLITIGDIDDVSGTTKTLSSILSREYNTEIYRDLFSIDKLKNIAGYNTFAPSVAGFFNSFRKLYRNNVNIKCYGIQSNINLLDKIGLDSKVYFVASRSFDIFNNESSFTLIEIGE